jgi:intracellular septation protein
MSQKLNNNALTLILEFLPLILFYVANGYGGIFYATAIFVIATLVCISTSLWLTRSLSALLIFNTVMVLVFGGLTLALHDALFVKLKPTVDYVMFSAVLLFGLARDRLFLKSALSFTFPGLHDLTWRTITRNWAVFFACMAVLNEVVWRSTATDTWVTYRVWFPPIATLLIGVAHIPYLLKEESSS